MYRTKSSTSFILALCLVALLPRSSPGVDGQIFDKILNTRSNNDNNETEIISNEDKNPLGERQPVVSKVRDMFKDMMSVNVPNGTSMGINVVSGLVKVERGEEAEKSGLVGNGFQKPLSVRIFGIPVFERGRRVRPLDSDAAPGEVPSYDRPMSSSRPDEDELPL